MGEYLLTSNKNGISLHWFDRDCDMYVDGYKFSQFDYNEHYSQEVIIKIVCKVLHILQYLHEHEPTYIFDHHHIFINETCDVGIKYIKYVDAKNYMDSLNTLLISFTNAKYYKYNSVNNHWTFGLFIVRLLSNYILKSIYDYSYGCRQYVDQLVKLLHIIGYDKNTQYIKDTHQRRFIELIFRTRARSVNGYIHSDFIKSIEIDRSEELNSLFKLIICNCLVAGNIPSINDIIYLISTEHPNYIYRCIWTHNIHDTYSEEERRKIALLLYVQSETQLSSVDVWQYMIGYYAHVKFIVN
jgi:hypothetical protein